jgi:hypothetical protein
MAFRIFAGLVAVALMLLYLVPPVIKLKDFELGAVILVGLAMMLVDLWQSIQSKDD